MPFTEKYPDRSFLGDTVGTPRDVDALVNATMAPDDPRRTDVHGGVSRRMNTTDFEKGQKQTNYHNLRNRCPHCGHRLEMKDGNRCIVAAEGAQAA